MNHLNELLIPLFERLEKIDSLITNKNTISDIINISNEEAFDRNNR